uniref:Ribonuclease H-like domain-containing protein n=1 Tax=Tanacetum cinerariifolium TaxID=118510 RepID=A0A6L2LEM8_TANCI|nr:ribonuclease H-like domain-containing protein [Tanacetum cinerariifolium]
MLRDNALTELRKKFEKAKKEIDDLKLTLGSQVFDSQVNGKYKIGERYHTVPPPDTGNFMPPKLDLILADVDDEPLIKDLVSDSEDENETDTKSKQRKPSFAKVEFVKPNEQVKFPRESVKQEEHNKQAKNPRKNSQSPRESLIILSYVQRNPQLELQEKGVIDSGYSRHMTGNMSYLSEYEEIDGGYVSFGGDLKGGKITSKGKISAGKLDFKDVYFVKELKFNLFSVSQICDKKNSVLFTNTECVVLSPDFKLLDESQVLLRVPKKNNMYSVDLKNATSSGGLTCHFAKAILDESNLWHRRLGHINFKTMNKLDSLKVLKREKGGWMNT